LATKAAAVAATQQSTKKKGGKDAIETAAVTVGWRMVDETTMSAGGRGHAATIRTLLLCNEHKFM
jgi:hypothetical protein